MPVKVKFLIAAFVFALGAIMSVIPYFTQDNFELLIPGIVLIALSTPFAYYWYAKTKSRYRGTSEQDILRQAELESRTPKENTDGKE